VDHDHRPLVRSPPWLYSFTDHAATAYWIFPGFSGCEMKIYGGNAQRSSVIVSRRRRARADDSRQGLPLQAGKLEN